jgi:DNA-directed RNA polymerase specialized sigma24 family protein
VERLGHASPRGKLIEICKEYKLGVQQATLPPLLEIDPDGLSADDASEREEPEEEANDGGTRRFRDQMLGDGERGLSSAEIAKLLGLRESTVRAYLSNEERRRGLARIRADAGLRKRALAIVAEQRA